MHALHWTAFLDVELHFNLMAGINGEGGLFQRVQGEHLKSVALRPRRIAQEAVRSLWGNCFLVNDLMQIRCGAHDFGQLQRDAYCSAWSRSIKGLKEKCTLFPNINQIVRMNHKLHVVYVAALYTIYPQMICGFPVGSLFVTNPAQQSPACGFACECLSCHFS